MDVEGRRPSAAAVGSEIAASRDEGSLVEILRRRMLQRGDRAAFRFLADGEEESQRLTGAELDRAARRIAARLQQLDPLPRRVLLLYPPGLEFIESFLGCLYAGIAAVPAYPPSSRRALPRLASIAGNSRPEAVLTRASHLSRYQKLGGEIESLAAASWIATDELPAAEEDWHERRIDRDSVAFLQYTSGSTSDPKGVVVRHRQLIHNQGLIQRAFLQDADSVVVSWLPVYHDMGLVGAVLQPLWSGGEAILMAPVSFLQKPVRWLRAISRFGATTSGGPNFAYDLCVDRVGEEERDDLDLGRWKVAFNGAEPVRPLTLERFGRAFADCGFSSRAFFPCYGLAEATLFVSGGAPGEEPRVSEFSARALEEGRLEPAGEDDARSLVGCGHAHGGQELLIVDPGSRRPVDGRVGEVWIRGESVADGYEGQPDLSRQVFAAQLEDDGRTFLRTGDLGFVRDGDLFLTGRLKDLIIVRGRNHHPEDIEATVEAAHPPLAAGGTAAFTVETGDGQRLVVVRELERRQVGDGAAIADAIRQAVSAGHELAIDEIVFIRSATLPKTPSGKVRRRHCRELYEQDGLTVLQRDTLGRTGKSAGEATGPTGASAVDALPELDLETLRSLPAGERRGAAERALRAVTGALLQIDPRALRDDRPLAAQGLDSLAGIQLQEVLERRFGIEIDLGEILEGVALEELMRRILGRLDDPAAVAAKRHEIPAPEATPRLSLEQERLWWLAQIEPDSPLFNIPIALQLEGEVDVDRLERCLRQIAERHEVLRSRFVPLAGQPSLELGAVEPWALERRDLGAELPSVDAEARRDRARQLVAETVAQPFDLAAEAPWRALWLGVDDETSVLLIVAHHLVYDLWSARVLLDELAALYAGHRVPPLEIRYSQFAAWQRRAAEGGRWDASLDFWRQRIAGLNPLMLPTDRPRWRRADTRAESRSFSVPPAVVRALGEFGREHEATLFLCLLAAFEALLARVCQQPQVSLATPVTGRPLREVRRSIGFFAYPMILGDDLADNPDFRTLLERVKTSALAAYRHQQVPFSKVVEALHDRTRLHPRMLFGLLDETGAVALPERLGEVAVEPYEVAQQATDFEQAWTLVRDASSGALRAQVVYQSELFDSATVEAMITSYLAVLETVIEQPQTRVEDLPLAPVMEERLERTRRREEPRQIVVSATFTADTLLDSLEFWSEQLGWHTELQVAPYNQVLQQLLSPESELNRNSFGWNVVLLRLEDAWRFLDAGAVTTPAEMLERLVDDLLDALTAQFEGSAERRAVPLLLCLCPASPRAQAEHGEILDAAEESLRSSLDALKRLSLITWRDVTHLYPLEDPHDAYGDEIGHLPYNEAFFTALGSYLIRRMYGQQRKPFKLIALDCDNTLWRGVCGEDGPQGVDLGYPYAALQRFMVAQQDHGKVLTLNSKNVEDDVWAVFDDRADMVLQRRHLASWRINWQAKSKNLIELSEELQLGLDSFVLVDDNPIECAEVQSHVPEVLALELPEDPDQVMATLEHCWAFDAWEVTEEDRQRTAFYQQNARREALRRRSGNLQTFLAELAVEVEIDALQPAQVGRVAQLSQRTNQFNCRVARRTEAEVAVLIGDGDDLEARTVSVRDRYGDYGLVGAMIFGVRDRALDVDTFLLSCRSLGRGVEHRMLADLGELALERGLDTVEIRFSPTRRNRPALNFLNSVATPLQPLVAAENAFRVPAAEAAACRYRPEVVAPVEEAEAVEDAPAEGQMTLPAASARELLRIARELNSLESIHREVRSYKRAQLAHGRALRGELQPPRNALEAEVAALWQELLGGGEVGVETSFFDLGGDSLVAVQLLSRLREQFQVELTMRDALDEAVTVASLARAIEKAHLEQASEEDIDGILAELDGLSEDEIQALLAEEGEMS